MKEEITPDLWEALQTVCIRAVSYHPEIGFAGATRQAVEMLLQKELIADIDRLNGSADFFLTPAGAKLLMEFET